MRRQARLTHCVAEKRVMRTIECGEYNSIAPHGASSMMAAARQSQHKIMLLKKMIRRVLGITSMYERRSTLLFTTISMKVCCYQGRRSHRSRGGHDPHFSRQREAGDIIWNNSYSTYHAFTLTSTLCRLYPGVWRITPSTIFRLENFILKQ